MSKEAIYFDESARELYSEVYGGGGEGSKLYIICATVEFESEESLTFNILTKNINGLLLNTVYEFYNSYEPVVVDVDLIEKLVKSCNYTYNENPTVPYEVNLPIYSVSCGYGAYKMYGSITIGYNGKSISFNTIFDYLSDNSKATASITCDYENGTVTTENEALAGLRFRIVEF